MGRQPTHSGRLSIDVDPQLKLRATLACVRAGISLTTLVTRGITLALAEMRAQAKDEDK